MTKQQLAYVEVIKTMNKAETIRFIRGSLTKDGKKLKFQMSGYDDPFGVPCTVHNQKILNVFAYLGLYDYTNFLFLDFYKGNSSVYLRYWDSDEFYVDENFTQGFSTSEIIYEIFKLTILTDKRTRRREY